MRKVLENIKHCPYTTCGHQAVLIGVDIEDPDEPDKMHYQVECETCCAAGPLCDTEDAAIQEWNAIERHEPSQIMQATCPVCAGKGTLYDPFDRTERICETCRPVEATAFGLRVILDRLRHWQEVRVPVDLLRHLNKIEIDLESAIKWATPVVPPKEQQ